MAPKDQATRLKEEGNALFTQKDYNMASVKYTEAIVVDGTNAVLYANRAACRLATRQYLDACMDAKRATELDPLYPKAFARLASAQDALGEHCRSIDAWQQALSALPKENLNAGELKQKEQYQAGLKAAREAKAEGEVAADRGIYMQAKDSNLPWNVASAMMPMLRSQEMVTSSAWVIWAAYSDFMEGVTAMKSLKKTPTPRGPMMMGNTIGLTMLTNGLMRDSRAFHIDDQNWISMYNDQVQLEAMKSRAWTEGGPEFIIEKAQERLRQEGWNSVRPALATTVRCWIMRGFVEGGLRGKDDVKVEFLSRALEVLKWGQIAWKNVPSDDRGAIFKDTFVSGVRDMYLEAFMQAYIANPGLNSKFSLDDLFEEAKGIIRDIDMPSTPNQEPVDPGFVYSFHIYPKARALAVQGFYHAQVARLHKGDVAASIDHYSKASLAYLDAAKLIPDDDEQHTWFLNCGLQNMWSCGRPLRETLEVMKRIRLSMPKMQKIWANSAMAKEGRDDALDTTLMVEKNALDQIAQGKFTLDDCMAPSYSS